MKSFANSMSRMNVGLCAIALLSGACDNSPTAATGNSGAAAPAPAARATDPGELSVGKEIVASHSANSFTSGTVTVIEGTKVTYEYGEPDATTKKRYSSTVDKAKVFVGGIAPKTAPKVGDFIIAKSSGGTWGGCEVKSAEGSVLGCEDWYGKVNNVDPKTVIVPDGATGADIKDSLAHATKERVFTEAAMAAGKPASPRGWKPKEKDAVAVEWMPGKWYAASVLKVDGNNVTIKYDTRGWPEPAVKNVSQMVPRPKAAQAVKAGQFVLVHVGDVWPHHRVVSVTKTAADVVDKGGKKTTVNLQDILAIGH